MYFYNSNSSNRFLTAKTATSSRTVHVLLFVIPCSQVEATVQIFAHVGVEPNAILLKSETEFFFDNAPHWAARGKGGGGVGAL